MTTVIYSMKFKKTEETNMSQGYIILSIVDRWMWLKNCEKVTVRKGKIDEKTLASILTKNMWPQNYAGYIIDDLVQTDEIRNKNTSTNHPTNGPQRLLDSADTLEFSSSSVQLNESAFEMPHPQLSPASTHLDSNLEKLMRPHQIEAARFLINRLTLLRSDSKENAPGHELNVQNTSTGAILADDMGTGKTLTSLATAWSICRQWQCKCIIACPATLVGNWRQEVLKWLGETHARSVLFMTGSNTGGAKNNSDAIAYKFVHSHPTVYPILVICYELFRPFAEAFNTLPTLQLLVCDEGHRLKNSAGTKTSNALSACVAKRRLVVTGTPLQNNLDELFAVVHFTAPGYLGSLTEFQAKFGHPVFRGQAAGASQRERQQASLLLDDLRATLTPILIRRTREEVLRALLPPRSEYLLSIPLSAAQTAEYDAICRLLLQTTQTASQSHCVEASDIETSVSGTRVVGLGTENLSSTVQWKSVLPVLTQLRQICNITLSLSDTSTLLTTDDRRQHELVTNTDISVNLIQHSVVLPTADVDCGSEGLVKRMVEQSSKMQLLESLLTSVRRKGNRGDRVVVVSNFTSVLDVVQCVCRRNHWATLRIDGSVGADKRTKIVRHFNSPDSIFFVLMLSARAGGVGLNLVGANRIVLMEPDWNPSTDSQAMGRVYRQGQTKPVWVYRFVSRDTLDQSILRRQSRKNLLSAVIEPSTNRGASRKTRKRKTNDDAESVAVTDESDLEQSSHDSDKLTADGLGALVRGRSGYVETTDEDKCDYINNLSDLSSSDDVILGDLQMAYSSMKIKRVVSYR